MSNFISRFVDLCGSLEAVYGFLAAYFENSLVQIVLWVVALIFVALSGPSMLLGVLSFITKKKSIKSQQAKELVYMISAWVLAISGVFLALRSKIDVGTKSPVVAVSWSVVSLIGALWALVYGRSASRFKISRYSSILNRAMYFLLPFLTWIAAKNQWLIDNSSKILGENLPYLPQCLGVCACALGVWGFEARGTRLRHRLMNIGILLLIFAIWVTSQMDAAQTRANPAQGSTLNGNTPATESQIPLRDTGNELQRDRNAPPEGVSSKPTSRKVSQLGASEPLRRMTVRGLSGFMANPSTRNAFLKRMDIVMGNTMQPDYAVEIANDVARLRTYTLPLRRSNPPFKFSMIEGGKQVTYMASYDALEVASNIITFLQVYMTPWDKLKELEESSDNDREEKIFELLNQTSVARLLYTLCDDALLSTSNGGVVVFESADGTPWHLEKLESTESFEGYAQDFLTALRYGREINRWGAKKKAMANGEQPADLLKRLDQLFDRHAVEGEEALLPLQTIIGQRDLPDGRKKTITGDAVAWTPARRVALLGFVAALNDFRCIYGQYASQHVVRSWHNWINPIRSGLADSEEMIAGLLLTIDTIRPRVLPLMNVEYTVSTEELRNLRVAQIFAPRSDKK